jgi:hypothetical protein
LLGKEWRVLRMSKKGMGRRDFLKSTAAGMGGFVYLSANEKSSPEKGQEKKEEKITYRTMGKTGMKLPVITMGVMNTSNPSLVRAALSNGLYFLDTAQTYQRGTNESMVGEVLKGRPRDSPPRLASVSTRIQAFTRKEPRSRPIPRRSTPASRTWGWITSTSTTTTACG